MKESSTNVAPSSEAREYIVETIRRLGEPLSGSDLRAIFENLELSRSQIAYHARILIDAEALISVAKRARNGSLETLYFLPRQARRRP